LTQDSEKDYQKESFKTLGTRVGCESGTIEARWIKGQDGHIAT
jgi:hypothetical protein